MHEIVREALDEHAGSLREIASETGVTYDWVLKVKQGRIKNPGTRGIQSLYDHFYPPASSA